MPEKHPRRSKPPRRGGAAGRGRPAGASGSFGGSRGASRDQRASPRAAGGSSLAGGPSHGEDRRTSPSRSLTEEIRSSARPGQADQAIRAFERAVSLLDRGRDAQAVVEALHAKELVPRSASVRELLGIALYRAERYRDALRELQAYRRMSGRADQNHLIADCHRALGSPDKAIEPVREALRAGVPDEARAEAAVVGASALADMSRFDEALGMVRGIARRDRGVRPFDLRVWYVTGDILERLGRRREAAEEFGRVIRHDADAFDAAERLARLQAGR
jgi:tetratricopeptide (TPR) repeat protein